MEKSEILFIYGVAVAPKADTNGNAYATIYCYQQEVDEDGCVCEPTKAQMSLNAGIAPIIYKTVIDAAAKGHTVQDVNGVSVQMLNAPVKTRGGVERKKAEAPFYGVDAEGNATEDVRHFVTVMAFGKTVDEVRTALDKAYDDRMDYYAEKQLFVDEAVASKPAVTTLIDQD